MPPNSTTVMEQFKNKVNQRVDTKLRKSYAKFANNIGQLFPNAKVRKEYGQAIATGRTSKEAYEQAFRPQFTKNIAQKLMEEVQEYLDAKG